MQASSNTTAGSHIHDGNAPQTIEAVAVAGDARPRASRSDHSLLRRLLPYAAIARPDHWFKNVFMVVGILLACFYYAQSVATVSLVTLLTAFVSVCLVASSNYVINEILDAPTDRHHPVKRNRPIPSGAVWLPVAYVEWIALGVIGMLLAWSINGPFAATAAVLLFMGLVYNVPPVRSKELPYIDVLSESVNNPLRLMLGWFAVMPSEVPPVSLLLAYWFVGSFFMASKRFAEYRAIGDGQVAAAYRSSFRYCDDNRLLVSMFCYSTAAALFLGVFIIRYHLELILSVPFIACFFGYYIHVALKHESAAAAPEKLYRETGLMIYLVVCIAVFVGLMFVDMPILYDWFNVRPSTVEALWRV